MTAMILVTMAMKRNTVCQRDDKYYQSTINFRVIQSCILEGISIHSGYTQCQSIDCDRTKIHSIFSARSHLVVSWIDLHTHSYQKSFLE